MRRSCHHIEARSIYKRRRELNEALFAKIIPVHEDRYYQRGTAGSLAFESAFDRELEPGAVLRYTDVEADYAQARANLAVFEEVWKRRVPNLPCPLHVEDGKVLCRMKPDARGREPYWEEHHDTAEQIVTN